MNRRVSVLCAAFLFASALPGIALAQYKWVDESGQVVYSDRPPVSARKGVQMLRGSTLVAMPVTTPAVIASSGAPGPKGPSASPSGVVEVVGDKSPAEKTAAEKAAADKPDADKQAKEAAGGPRTFAERDMAFKRRQQERELAERKQAEQTQKAAQVAKVCEDRRTDLRTLDSGARISRVDANGERSFMSEDELSKRRDSLQKALNEDCSRG